MQIDFNAKKLKEAKEYVNLLNPSQSKEEKPQKKREDSLLKKLVTFLFK